VLAAYSCLLQVLFAVGFEVAANGIKNGSWTLPKKGDLAFPTEQHVNGAANGFHQAGSAHVAAKKQL
jgi:hypothetical protein